MWRQWRGTIVRSVVKNEAAPNVVWAIALLVSIRVWPGVFTQSIAFFTGQHSMRPASAAAVTALLAPLEGSWKIAQQLVAFVLSFFLSQTYAVWRKVYTLTRQIQGRLSDVGLLFAVNAERDELGVMTPRALAAVETSARYARLFNVLYFASITRQYAPLATPAGLRALVASGDLLTEEERLVLVETSSWHQTVCAWLGAVLATAAADGAILGGVSTQYHLSKTLTTLRATYASIPDQLAGRMPLAYAHMVQLLVDLLCLTAPLALLGQLGAVGAVAGTAFLTLFYAGVNDLAKMFLDPFDNETSDSRSGIKIEADTLIAEVNALTRRWAACTAQLPTAALPQPTQSHKASTDDAPQQPQKREFDFPIVPSNNILALGLADTFVPQMPDFLQ